MKPQPTNKAISDSITALTEKGIDVNINIQTEVLVRLSVFAIVLTVLISATMYGMHILKNS